MGIRAGAGTAALNACECAAEQLPAHSMWETAKTISSREGLPVLWRGTSASLLIAVPMVGIYMPLYDALLEQWSDRLGRAAPVAAGTAARTAACFCVAPFELLRTRLQASAGTGVSMRSTIANFFLDHHHTAAQQQQQQLPAAAQQQQQQRQTVQAQPQVQQQLSQQQQQLGPRTVLRAVPRMWTGFSATLVRDVPFSALYWALVEPFRQAMLPRNSHWNPWPPQQQQQQQQGLASSSSSSGSSVGYRRQPHVHHTQLEILIANMVSGFIAGGVAAGLTTPFDVVKTRMQIARPSSSSSSSGVGGVRVWSILQDVYRKDGIEGLFTGLKPRAYRAAPACAIVISVYELLKHWLTPE
jgi:solute carrier family 25 protein 39/40